MILPPNKGAAANGLSAVRSSVAGNRERTVRSTAAPEAVAELGRPPFGPSACAPTGCYKFGGGLPAALSVRRVAVA